MLVRDDIAMLDEKWFYVTSRRKTIKRLPLQPGEEEGDDLIPQPKMRSRCHPIKSMFMGVVGRPREDKNFNGKIYLERISKKKTSRKFNCSPELLR